MIRMIQPQPDSNEPFDFKQIFIGRERQIEDFERVLKQQRAMKAIEKALEFGLPPPLLTPLYWLEKDNPAFFDQYAKPLLVLQLILSTHQKERHV